ncbi:hypothetical protein M404DRAFT_994449 [Pisolithus tinctorius Marx 270]|uniref:Uncharacterized protein n=1 Tax=Pisolithus tinctorius Marx 270 TaxID=870435 RepID=A0A0C3JRJ1_PISTI|nr:hypothetical protein M404DRAFT_994449 [Pisolithus tinctorius Marx 270]
MLLPATDTVGPGIASMSINVKPKSFYYCHNEIRILPGMTLGERALIAASLEVHTHRNPVNTVTERYRY